MKKSEESSRKFVVCINNQGYPASLELHKIYRVVPDKNAAADGDIRIIDESGEEHAAEDGLANSLRSFASHLAAPLPV